MAVLIKVTAEDIAKGEVKACLSCPLALAIGRAVNQPVEVGVSEWWLSLEPAFIAYTLPLSAYVFRRQFDLGEPVEPFEFELIGYPKAQPTQHKT